jgi:hypothetical protein
MKRSLFALLLLSAAAFGQSWSNCSAGHMQPTGASGGCDKGPGSPWNYQDIGWTGSRTFQDSCTNSITQGSVYFTSQSTVTGYGGCQYFNSTWHPCPASFTTAITAANSANDYNRMYNYAYDYDYTGTQIPGAPPGTYQGGNCVKTQTWRQDLKQCGPIACPTTLTGCCINPTQCSSPGSGLQCSYSTCNCTSITPIIIDTTGHGFDLTSADDGVRFDFFGDGHPLQMAWTHKGSGVGFLVLDRNRNGTIDSGAEQFGNMTPQPESKEKNGYEALIPFDTNHDGVIDWHDPIYQRLQVWIDDNHDGISQPEELHSLASVGVYSIGLRYHANSKVDAHNNAFHYCAPLNQGLSGDSPDGRYTCDVTFAANPNPEVREGCKQKQLTPLTQLTPDVLRDSLH